MSKIILYIALVVAIIVFAYMFVGSNGSYKIDEQCQSTDDCTVTIGACDCYAVSKNSRTTAKDIEAGKLCTINECLAGVLQISAECQNNQCVVVKK